MNYSHILKRALQITWRQRALWLFGFLLALFGGSGGGSNGGGGGSNGSGQAATMFQYRLDRSDLARLRFSMLSVFEDQRALSILVGAAVLVLLLIAITVIVRYLSTGALIAMVDEVEETGNTRLGTGFRRGWQHWLRLLAISLVIGVPLVLAALVLLLLFASPLVLAIAGMATSSASPLWMGELLIIWLVLVFLLWLPVVIVAAIAADLLLQFTYRRSVLAGEGVFASIREGCRMVRRNLRDAGLTWLILFGIDLVVSILLIPVMLIGLVLLAVPTIALWALSQSVLVAMATGAPLLLIFIVALCFIAGLLIVFRFTVWTLVYRELALRERQMAMPAGTA